MEDLTGLIIYIILAIIGVMATIYRNKNKRKSVISAPIESSSVEVEPPENYENEYDPFAGMFEEKVEEEDLATENDIREEELVAEQDINKEELIIGQDVKEEDTYNKGYEEGEAVFDETKEVLISDDDSGITAGEISDTELITDISVTEEGKPIIAEHDKSSEKKERFDARRAIIYSEILNRREYPG